MKLPCKRINWFFFFYLSFFFTDSLNNIFYTLVQDNPLSFDSATEISTAADKIESEMYNGNNALYALAGPHPELI